MTFAEAVAWGHARDLPRFPGYKVTSFGQVLSFKRKTVYAMKPSQGFHFVDSRGMAHGVSPRTVNLSIGGAPAVMHVGEALLRAFVGPPPTRDHGVFFVDGDVWNTRLHNLRWDLAWAHQHTDGQRLAARDAFHDEYGLPRDRAGNGRRGAFRSARTAISRSWAALMRMVTGGRQR